MTEMLRSNPLWRVLESISKVQTPGDFKTKENIEKAYVKMYPTALERIIGVSNAARAKIFREKAIARPPPDLHRELRVLLREGYVERRVMSFYLEEVPRNTVHYKLTQTGINALAPRKK